MMIRSWSAYEGQNSTLTIWFYDHTGNEKNYEPDAENDNGSEGQYDDRGNDEECDANDD